MNDLERILESGREVPTPDGLTEKIKESIDGQLGTGAAAAVETTTIASSVPVSAWAAGLLVVGVVVLLAGGFVGQSGDSTKELGGDGRDSADLHLATLASDGVDSETSSSSSDLTFELESEPNATTETAEEGTTADAAPIEGVVFGVVRDLRGEAVSGARVTLVLNADRRRNDQLTVVTDETGYYEASLDALASAHAIAISREISAMKEQALALDALIEDVHFANDEQLARNVRLERDAQIELDLEARDRQRALELEYQKKKKDFGQLKQILAEDTRITEAVRRDLAKTRAASEERAIQRYTEQADKWMRLDQAAAEMSRAPQHTVTITALATGFQPLFPIDLSFRPQGRTELDLVLSDSEALSGVVVDARGNPVEGAQVEIVASFEGDPLPNTATRATTDVAGEFSFDHLSPGEYLVRASGKHIETATAWVVTGTELVTLEVPTAGVATISVVDEEGTSQFPVVVELIQDERTLAREWINGASSARFEGLRAGDYGLRVFTGSGGVYPAVEESFNVAAGEELAFELMIPPAVSVAGTLVLPTEELTEEGEVRAGDFLVAAYHLGGTYSARRGAYSPVAADGTFELSDLPAGHYVFGVAKRLDSSMIIRCFRDVVLSAGNGAQDVRIPFVDTPLAGLGISVVDEQGVGIAGASITFERARTMGRSTHRTDQAGEFAIQLHHDPFHLIVAADGYAKVRRAVKLIAGRTENVVVALEPSATLPDALATALRDEGSIILHNPISIRSLFAAIEFAEPGALLIDPDLAASRILDETKIGARGVASLRTLLRSVIREQNLEFELEGARLVLRFGEVNPR